MLRTTAIAKELAAIERKLQETENATLKEALKKKQARLKDELKDTGKSTAQLAKTLLSQRELIKSLSKVDFNDLIRRLSKKPEYSFLKTMPKSTIKTDLERRAKPVGWRFKGRGNYDKPTKAEILKGKKTGTVYREVRPRRSDVSQVVRLEDGGWVQRPIKIKKDVYKFEDNQGVGYIVKRDIMGKTTPVWIVSNDEEGTWDGSHNPFYTKKDAEKYIESFFAQGGSMYAGGGGIDSEKTYLVGKPEVDVTGRFNKKRYTYKSAKVQADGKVIYGQVTFSWQGTSPKGETEWGTIISAKEFNELLKKYAQGGSMYGDGGIFKTYVVEYTIDGIKQVSEYLLLPTDRIENLLPPNAIIISINEKKTDGGSMYADGGGVEQDLEKIAKYILDENSKGLEGGYRIWANSSGKIAKKIITSLKKGVKPKPEEVNFLKDSYSYLKILKSQAEEIKKLAKKYGYSLTDTQTTFNFENFFLDVKNNPKGGTSAKVSIRVSKSKQTDPKGFREGMKKIVGDYIVKEQFDDYYSKDKSQKHYEQYKWSLKNAGIKSTKETSMEKGGSLEQESLEMINNQTVNAKHHIDELKQVLSHQKHIEPWVIAKMQRATTDLADITHYLDGKDPKMAFGGVVYDISNDAIDRMEGLAPTDAMLILNNNVLEIYKSFEEEGFEKDEIASFLSYKIVQHLNKMAQGGKLKAAQQKKFDKVMHEWGQGKLHSGSEDGPIVKDQDQALAIAYAEANASKMAQGGGVEISKGMFKGYSQIDNFVVIPTGLSASKYGLDKYNIAKVTVGFGLELNKTMVFPYDCFNLWILKDEIVILLNSNGKRRLKVNIEKGNYTLDNFIKKSKDALSTYLSRNKMEQGGGVDEIKTELDKITVYKTKVATPGTLVRAIRSVDVDLLGDQRNSFTLREQSFMVGSDGKFNIKFYVKNGRDYSENMKLLKQILSKKLSNNFIVHEVIDKGNGYKEVVLSKADVKKMADGGEMCGWKHKSK